MDIECRGRMPGAEDQVRRFRPEPLESLIIHLPRINSTKPTLTVGMPALFNVLVDHWFLLVVEGNQQRRRKDTASLSYPAYRRTLQSDCAMPDVKRSIFSVL